MSALNSPIGYGSSPGDLINGPASQDHEEPLCAILYDKMQDPVRILNSEGRFENELYERSALEIWLKEKGTSPHTRLAVKKIVTEKPLFGLPIDKIEDPVQIINSQGQLEEQVYERASLDFWLQSNPNLSPVTKQEIKEIIETKYAHDSKILRTAKKIGITALKILGSLALTLTCTAGYAIVGAAIGAAVLEGAAALAAVILCALLIGLIVSIVASTPPSELVRPQPGIAPAPLPPPGSTPPLFPPGLKALPLKLAKAGAIAGAAIGGVIGMNVGIRVSKNVFWGGQDLFSEENKDIFLLQA